MIAMKAIHIGPDWDAHVSDGQVFGHGHAKNWKDAIDDAIADYYSRRAQLEETRADHVS